jgi:hypothetical protein
MVEDGIRSNDRCHNRSDSAITTSQLKSPQFKPITNPTISIHSPIKGLRKIDSYLGVLGRPTNRNIRIRRRLQTPQPISNNENRRAKAPKRPIQDARPGHQRSDAVQTETPDEGRFVAVVAQDPVGVAEGGEGVGAEVGGLQAGGAGASDIERVLEVFV